MIVDVEDVTYLVRTPVKEDRKLKAWRRQQAADRKRRVEKDRRDFLTGDARRKKEICQHRWWRATFGVLWKVKCDGAEERLEKLARALRRTTTRLRTRYKVLTHYLDSSDTGAVEFYERTRMHKLKLEIDRVHYRVAKDAYQREGVLQFITAMDLGYIEDIGTHLKRLQYFGLRMEDTWSTTNFFKMSRALVDWCIGDRDLFHSFLICPMRYGKFPNQKSTCYPVLFQWHLEVALADIIGYWTNADAVRTNIRRRDEEQRKREACPYSRWQRLVRLAVKQDRADKEATARNEAERQAHRAMRAALVPKTKRALTVPGPSRKEGPVRWVEEAPDDGDRAKRDATKEASLRAVQAAKAAKRAREQREFKAMLEQAHHLAIGDAIVEDD